MGTTAIGLACVLGFAESVWAADECGPIVNGQVACSPAGNDYTSGITYSSVDDLTIVVDDDARIFPGIGNDGIDVTFAGGDVTIEMNGKIITQGDYDWGVRVYEPAGFVTVLDQGTINTSGDYGHGISIYTANGASIETTYGIISTSGAHSHGITVLGTNGPVDATLHAIVSTEGQGSHGIAVYGTDGDVIVTQTSGFVTTEGDGSSGILISRTDGSVDVIVDGEIETQGDRSSGIYVDGTSGNVTISAFGDISTYGIGGTGIGVKQTTGDVNIVAHNIVAQHAVGVYVGYTSGNVDVTATGMLKIEDRNEGIYVSNTDGHVIIMVSEAGSIETDGTEADGIRVGYTGGSANSDYVSILVDGSIVTLGPSSNGIYAHDNSGNVNVILSASGRIETDDGHGIFVYRSGNGDNDHVTVQASGDIATRGSYGDGIHIDGATGTVDISASGSITSYYLGSRGISVENTGGPVSVTASGTIVAGKYYGSRPAIASYAPGIYVNNTDGSAMVTLSETGSITSYGGYAHGIAVNNVNGDATITVDGTIGTEGNRSYGVLFTNIAGDASIVETGSIVTQGDHAKGIGILSAGGNVTVSSSGTIHTYGTSADGIYVNAAGDVSISTSGAIITAGSAAEGIFIRNAQNVVLNNAGDIAAAESYAISVRSSPYVTINNSGTISGNELRGAVLVTGASSLNFTNSGRITSPTNGLYNFFGGYTSIVLTQSSDIETAGHGIYVNSPNVILGEVYISNSGSIVTTGDGHNGIRLNGVDGYSKIVQSGTGSILTYGVNSDGIYLFGTNASVDSISIRVDGSITTIGESAEGIYASYVSGAATVAVDGDIKTYGLRSNGVLIRDNSGDVNVTLSGSISTGINYAGSPSTFVSAHGIFLDGNDGNTVVTLSDGSTITTHGLISHGVALVDTVGYTKITASGDIITEGGISSGISLFNTTGNVRVTTEGSIVTSGAGSHGEFIVNTAGNVTVAAEGSIVTNGTGSLGIVIFQADDVSVTASGDITTKGYYSSGIRLSNAEKATVTAAGTITTYERQSYGIDIDSTGGSVDVTVSGEIATHGRLAHGISIDGTGSASDNHNVTVDIAGSVSASGIDADAVQVNETYGAVLIKVSGSVTGGGGGGAGISLDNPNAISSTVTISGTADVGALSDVAIQAVEPVTISNAGTITGLLSLGDGGDSLTNTGTWYLRNHADTDGDGVRDTEGVAGADLGGGDDTFLNYGTLSLLKGVASLWVGEILNLETFRNSGIIDLQDGIAGDSLSISGNFQPEGGSLLLDVAFEDGISPQAADVLQLHEVSQPTGATKIYPTSVGGNGVISGSGILLVDADDDQSDGEAFALGQAVMGAYEYELYYDDAADAWYLRNLVTDTGAPDIFAGAEEYPALMTSALASFESDWNALHNRISDSRLDEQNTKIEPAAWTRSMARSRPWLQVNGGRQKIAADAQFNQQAVKLEAGADVLFALQSGGTALIGAFVGLGRDKQDFDSSATEAESDAALGGLYASFRSGGFYANAIAKYEHHQAKVKSVATDDEGSSFDIDLLGGSLEAGYRFALAGATLQPRLRLNSAHAGSTSLEDASSTRIELESADSLEGEAAARLSLPLDAGEIYVDGGARHEFLGETNAIVSGLNFGDALPGTSGFVAGGFAFRAVEGKALLALEGSYSRGNEGEEIRASAALRVVY